MWELRRLPFSRVARRHAAYLLITLALLATACEGGEEPASITSGDRLTISLALFDNVGHRAALYAIEQGIVTSPTVDLVVTYLSPSVIEEAARSKQYDVVETTPLAVPAGTAEDFPFVVLSAGLEESDGTFLFVAAGSRLQSPADLAGGTVGVVSQGDPSTLVTRYLLQRYEIETNPAAEGVTIEVAPADSLPALLQNGEIDAAVLTEQAAFRLLSNEDFRVLSRVTDELRELAGAPVISSILVTYPDVVGQKAEALGELNRLLAQSVTYFQANEDTVIEAVAAEQQADVESLRWWWERYDLPLGDLSSGTQQQLLQAWEMARALGDVESYPDLADVLFNPEAVTPTPD